MNEPIAKQPRISNDAAKIPTFNDLNQDCLTSIFKLLPYDELLVVCDVNRLFRATIADLLICNYLVDVTHESQFSTQEIFSMFGRRMRRIRATGINSIYAFEELLIFIITYCQPNQLTEIQLQCAVTIANKKLWLRAVPFFSNIKKLVLVRLRNHRQTAYETLIKYMFAAPSQLESLNLYGYSLTKQWSRIRSLDNLVEFRIHYESYSTHRIDHLAEFIATKVKLQVFSYIGDYAWTRRICIAIKNCTQLESLTQIDYGRQHSRDAEPTPRERNQFLNHLPRIKHLSITSHVSNGDDIYLTLSNLQANKISLESLKISIYDGSVRSILDLDVLQNESMQWLNRTNLHSFKSLKIVQITIGTWHSHTRSLFATNFMYAFLSKLSNLKSLRLKVEQPVTDVEHILRHLPYLESFSLYKTNLKHLPAAVRRFKKALEISNGKRGEKPLIHLFLDDIQYNEFEVLRNIDNVCTFSKLGYVISDASPESILDGFDGREEYIIPNRRN